MTILDPMRLAERQLTLDRKKTRAFAGGKAIGAELFARKVARMSASPLAFLRGAAPLFYELLARRPELARGPSGPRGDTWIVGDLHLENFGAYHPDRHGHGERQGQSAGAPTFALNDFDDAVLGPWRLDVLRLTTSLLLGGRELGCHGARAVALSSRLVDAYVEAAFHGARPGALPRPVARLVEQVSTRTRRELLDARTEIRAGHRRFIRGERYHDLRDRFAREVPAALAKYAARLDAQEGPTDEQLALVDCAIRVAGTGSLGALRIAALVRGKGGIDGGWIFDLKEQGAPSAALLVGAPRQEPAARVAAAFHALVEHPPRMLGRTRIDGRSMFVRRLSPQEDKLDLTRLRSEDLDALSEHLGALLGAAHARGAATPPRARDAWTRAERGAVLDHAIAMAGVHESVYLAYCRLATR